MKSKSLRDTVRDVLASAMHDYARSELQLLCAAGLDMGSLPPDNKQRAVRLTSAAYECLAKWERTAVDAHADRLLDVLTDLGLVSKR